MARDLRMAAVAGVAVAPEDRGRGTGRALMTALLDHIAADSYPLSMLYPATMPLYRSLGWELAGHTYAAAIPARSLRTITPPQTSALRRATPGDAAAVRRCTPRSTPAPVTAARSAGTTPPSGSGWQTTTCSVTSRPMDSSPTAGSTLRRDLRRARARRFAGHHQGCVGAARLVLVCGEHRTGASQPRGAVRDHDERT